MRSLSRGLFPRAVLASTTSQSFQRASSLLFRHRKGCRGLHDARAQFTVLGGVTTDGPLVVEPNRSGAQSSYRDIRITVGEATESFIYIDPEVGDAFRHAVEMQVGKAHTGYTPTPYPTLPLKFKHKERHFVHGSLPFPRIEIDRELQPPTAPTCNKTCETGVSAATMWLSQECYAITLDGTFDELFEREARESSQRLKAVLVSLKDY